MNVSHRLIRFGALSFFLALTILCVGILLTYSAAPALAQATSTGTVVGQVTDPQHAAIGGADVQIIDLSTNVPRVTTSNDQGRYTFVNVPPGLYTLVVNKPGFSQTKIPSNDVQVGLALTLDVTMQVGSTSTTVEVTASGAAELQTMNATVGSTMSAQSILMLPQSTLDASGLAVYQPGVAPGGQVAGAVSDQNTYQLDGGNNSNDMDGTQTTYTTAYASNGAPSGAIPTPIESVEEFKVGTVGQTADFGNSAGAQVSLVTKRGTNQFHGSLYEYYLSSDWADANSWKNNHTLLNGLATPLPTSHRNRYGGAIGGPVLPKFLGGKTYFFANWEGFRYNQAATTEKTVPSAALRAGLVTLPNTAGVETVYNLNPTPVNFQGTTYAPAVCGTALCDPRGIGLNSLVSQIWSKLPLPNDLAFGDQFNTQGFIGTVSEPQSSAFFVARLDHDFGDKWHFMSSYRYYGFTQLTTNQLLLSPSGQFSAVAPRPQKPDYIVAGLTTNITSNFTNDLHINYLRNWWLWGDQGGAPQLPGLGGALEIGGESTAALIPENVNNQSTRQRFWDGQDQVYRDDLSLLHGNHLFQFGGTYQRDYDYHQRTDNGSTENIYPVDQIGGSLASSLNWTGFLPTTLPSAQVSNYQSLAGEVLGIVTQGQEVVTRSGPQLTLNPPLTPAFDQSVIPFYNMYFSDTWHMKPTLTLTYGLSYEIEMPPYEINGKQVEALNTAGQLINTESYLQQRQTAALNGAVTSSTFDPAVEFETVANSHQKYPYNPFYGGLSPRVAVAWNPNFDSGILGTLFGHGKTVIRGGYSRIYGRLNGVDLVLIPLLGTGLMQALACDPVLIGGACGASGAVTPAQAMRIGTDGTSVPLPAVGNTLPQPYVPGLNGNAEDATDDALDPNFKPNRSDQINLTIQHSFNRHALMEVGYIGRIIRNEYQAINIDSVPFMTTLNGQAFSGAFANMFAQVNSGATVSAQPWFESALGGPSSSYCTGFASCTAAVASKLSTDVKLGEVYSLWSSLAAAPSWTLGRTLLDSAAYGGSQAAQTGGLYEETSLGRGNYNALFLTFTARDFHGWTAQSNLTWGRALGTGATTQSTSSYTVLNNWNIDQSMYGPQTYDIKFIYNLTGVYTVPFFKTQKSLIGKVLGGWYFAPIFTAQSGAPVAVANLSGSAAQSFGEDSPSSSGTTLDSAVAAAPYTGGNSAHEGTTGFVSGTIGANTNLNGGSGINMFGTPAQAAATYAEFRSCTLGVDTSCGSEGILRGLPTWNLDAAFTKDILIMPDRGIGATLRIQMTNVLNHFQPSTGGLNLSSPQTWGYINSQANSPRAMEFGLRIHF